MSTKGQTEVIDHDPEVVRLLREIRDLLRPIADAYQDQYEDRQAERQRIVRVTVKSLVDATPKRRKAWDLVDGVLSQREIHKRSGMDEGGLSRFFKTLREQGALEGEPPRRTMEV